jgi:YD repeat-containing protein
VVGDPPFVDANENGTFRITPTGPAGGGYALDYVMRPLTLDPSFWFGDLSPGFINSPPSGIAQSNTYHTPSWTYNTLAFQSSFSGDPVSVLNGNYYTIETDLEIAGRGCVNLRLVRSYNSRLDYAGPLGHGWTHTFDQHLRLEDGEAGSTEDDRVVWVTETGGEVPWDDPNRAAQPLVLVPQPWVHDTLQRNGDGSYTLRTKAGMVYGFRPVSAGKARLAYLRDRNGNTITCNYDATGRLESVTDTAGRALDFVYDDPNGVIEIRDAAWFGGSGGRTWRYRVDANGDLVEYWDPEQTAKEAQAPGSGQPWRYSYYSDSANPALDHNLECWIRPQGGRQPVAGVAPLCGDAAQGHAWMHFAYYPVRSTDPGGLVSELTLDANGLVSERRTLVPNPDSGTPEPLEERVDERNEYDAMDRRIASTNALNQRTDLDYDARDRLVGITTPLGLATRRSYDPDGNLVEEIDPSGASWRFESDAEGRPSRAIDPLGRVFRTEYDPEGRVTEQVGPGERTLASFVLDAEGNPTSRFDGENHEFRSVFDELGRATSVTGPIGEPEQGTTAFEYDLTGLLPPPMATSTRGCPATLPPSAIRMAGSTSRTARSRSASCAIPASPSRSPRRTKRSPYRPRTPTRAARSTPATL